jgi:hypothetical protein
MYVLNLVYVYRIIILVRKQRTVTGIRWWERADTRERACVRGHRVPSLYAGLSEDRAVCRRFVRGGLRVSGSKIQLKKTKAAKPQTHNSDTKKIQLYSFLEAETAAYVSSICFLKFPRSNRCRL